MKQLSYAGLVAGLAVLVLLVAWRGVGEVGAILAESGWTLLWLPPAWLPSLLIAAWGWAVLFPAGQAPPYRRLLAAQWIGRAVNTLLPVAQLGGEVVKARLISLWGADAVLSAASVVVDKTAQAVAAILWGLIGVGLLAALSLGDGLALPVLGGLAVLGAGVGGFVLVQRAGLFGIFARLGRVVGRTAFWDGVADRARDVDVEVRGFYARSGRIALASCIRTMGLVVQTGEIWLAAYLLGHPIGIVEALMLKSLSSTLSDAAFFVPNSYGVQEGAYVVLGGLLGQTPEFMLALSLATRIREIIVDVPGLLAWQHAEGRNLLQRLRAGRVRAP